MPDTLLTGHQLEDAWPILDPAERAEGFALLPNRDAEDFFEALSPRDQAALLLAMDAEQRRRWMRFLEPDDAADLLQAVDEPDRTTLLGLLDGSTRLEVSALLAYAEDEAGGLMNPHFARVRPDMTVGEAITYLRRQASQNQARLHYAYVLDQEQVLRGVLSFRELFQARDDARVEEVMETAVITVPEHADQEDVARLVRHHGLLAVPVLDPVGRMKGIVTADDLLDVAVEEATEDFQKVGGSSPLADPYLEVGVGQLLGKRAGWLVVLFLGQLLTASAMGMFEDEIARAVVLALFIPLIISSGGNSGSQAATLVIRALALGEVRARDWWRVCRREVAVGLALGGLLALLGLLRIAAGEWLGGGYGEHYLLVGLTVAGSLVGVVLWGTVAGSMLPFVLRRFGVDPATASAPFVATLVDVTGLVIYFSVASAVLRGTLL